MSEKQKRTWRVPVQITYEGYALVEAEDSDEAAILVGSEEWDTIFDLDIMTNLEVIGKAMEVTE